MDKENKEFIYMWATEPIIPAFWGTPNFLIERNDLVFPGKGSFSYFDGKVLTTYMDLTEVEETKLIDSKNYLNPEYYKEYVRNFERESKNWWNWIRKVEKKDYSNASRQELLEYHKKFTEYQRDAIGYFGSTRPEPSFAIEQKLIEILRKYHYDNWPKIFASLTSSIELDDIQREQLDFTKLIEENPTEDQFLNHASKYPWLVYGLYDESEVIKFLKELSKEHETNYSKKLKQTNQEKQELKEKQQEIINQIKDKQDKEQILYLSKLLQEQSIRRMDIKSYYVGSYYLSRNFWKKLAQTLNLKINDFVWYIFPPEVEQLLQENYKENIQETIQERKKAYTIDSIGKDYIKILSGKPATDLFNKRIKKPEKNKEIKGQTANLGKYTGKVRKIIPGDIEVLKGAIKQFQQGEVLVTTMTQPNMMVIAKKASAIVTDEGGITSHAAIISRELKIPCIVGCLHSMQVLNTGDLVEVNANKGIIKILKKAEESNKFDKKNIKLTHLYTDINATPTTMSIHAKGWYGSELLKTCNVKTFGNMAGIIKDYELKFCFEKERYKQAQKNIKNLIITNKLPIKHSIKESIKIGERIIKLFRDNQNKIKKLEDKEILSLFLEFFNNGAKLCSYGYLAPLSDFPEPFLSSEFEKILSSKSTKGEITFLTQSSIKRPLNIAKEELLKIILNKGDINKWLEKWYWIEFGHLGPGYTLEQIKKEYKDLLDNPSKANLKLKELLKKNKDLRNKQNNRFKELKLNKNEIALFNQAQDITFSKAYRTDLINCINAFFDIIFNIYSKKLDIKKEIFRFLTKEELVKIINREFKPDEKEILKRKNNSIWLINEKTSKFLVDKKAEDFRKNSIIFQKEKISNMLSGSVAFPGNVKGLVKIISSSNEINKVKEGDIIVALQTTPELLPAMKKAAAIVTDIGGLTCHAAIVSRELKKPCIIGTKHATKVLKDGDLVEVDANKGIIKILKRK